MELNEKAILKQIDAVQAHVLTLTSLAKRGDLWDLSAEKGGEAATLLRSTIERLAPPGSSFQRNLAQTTVYGGPQGLKDSIGTLKGILNALRTAYENGYLESIQELTHAEMSGDFLSMADHLLETGYKDPAAVISGSVLEGHLKKIAIKNGINVAKPDGSPKKADLINAELVASQAYSKLDQKSVTAWLDLRNKAAHGSYEDYTREQVSLMIQGVQNFVSRLPA